VGEALRKQNQRQLDTLQQTSKQLEDMQKTQAEA
jgi:hypothetical protein